MSATRILLADDHPMVRLGLRTILEDHQEYEVCGEAGDGSQTLALAYQLAPDILIVDISMPGPNGLEVSAQLREAMPTTKVLIITIHDTQEMLRAAAAAGALPARDSTFPCRTQSPYAYLHLSRSRTSGPGSG